MKKILVGIMLFSACAYGMKNKNGMLSNTRTLEKSGGTFITLKSNDDLEEILDKDFLPEAWYRQIIEQKLVQKYDKAGNPLIILENISSEMLPLVKNALYLMKQIHLTNSGHKATQIAYKSFQALNLPLDKVAELLQVLDYFGVPKVLIAGLAKLFVQLTEGEELDLSLVIYSDEVKKEINKYLYLFYNKEIKKEEPQGDRHLHDLLKFNKLDKNTILLQDNTVLDLSKQRLASMCSITKLIKLGIVANQLRKLNLSNNQLKKVPTNLVKYCPELTELDLSNNQLQELPPDLVKYCPQLMFLKLSNNLLTIIPADLVTNCIKLWGLNLSNNKLKEIPTGLVKYCSKLTDLDLSNNQLEILPVNLVSNCPKLGMLDLSNNQLTFLPMESLEKLSEIAILRLMNNPLKIDIEVLPLFLQQAIRNAEEQVKQAEENRKKMEEQNSEQNAAY